mmetsp:Transcript_22774/g.54904  ORF Transcript_22774/g.54904 Transcript_22774/m.54904 type:complete len:193 (+) Transcript_22774:44-622(+)
MKIPRLLVRFASSLIGTSSSQFVRHCNKNRYNDKITIIGRGDEDCAANTGTSFSDGRRLNITSALAERISYRVWDDRSILGQDAAALDTTVRKNEETDHLNYRPIFFTDKSEVIGQDGGHFDLPYSEDGDAASSRCLVDAAASYMGWDDDDTTVVNEAEEYEAVWIDVYLRDGDDAEKGENSSGGKFITVVF